MDTALSQISSMKSEIKKRDAAIAKLEEKLSILTLSSLTEPKLEKLSKKTINTKRSKAVIVAGNAVDEVPTNKPAIAGDATDEVPAKKLPEDDF